MKTVLKLTIATMLLLTVTNCKKDKVTSPEPEPLPALPVSGNLNLYFEGMVGLESLVFSTKTYTNQIGNSYNITMAKYYISNIKLTKTDNSVFVVNNSYHIIDLSDSLLSLVKLSGVPYGNYKAIQLFKQSLPSLRQSKQALLQLQLKNNVTYSVVDIEKKILGKIGTLRYRIF